MIFNVIAAYKDHDGGVYEWEGEAVDYDDAVRQAQAQAWDDNHHGDDAEPEDMLDAEKGFSVIDVTVSRALKAEVVACLREEADCWAGSAVSEYRAKRSDYLRELADRFESMPVHA